MPHPLSRRDKRSLLAHHHGYASRFGTREEGASSIDKFEELYDYATKDNKHDALIIDNHNRVNKDFMFRKGWNIVLKIT